jgi:hypothetical protein
LANFKDASRRQFDLIAAWSVDRLGRSLQDLVGFLTEVHALGINLFLHQQGIDTTTPAGKAISDDKRLRRVRAGHDPRAGQVGAGARKGAGQEDPSTPGRKLR